MIQYFTLLKSMFLISFFLFTTLAFTSTDTLRQPLKFGIEDKKTKTMDRGIMCYIQQRERVERIVKRLFKTASKSEEYKQLIEMHSPLSWG